ncbi:MAG: sigma-54 dependent transcriptional regulator [Bacteroidota bacterium]|nr:sigma-54 dependent transcriptional regulator [Bacteroidota bacterium]
MAKFLLVEDDLTFSLILEGYLKNQGFSVNIVHRLKEGIKAVESQNFNIILLDYRLPDGIGFELLQVLRKKNLHIPVIMMTSFHDVRIAVQAMRLGAFDYITKPVNPDELLMVVKEALFKKGEPSIAIEKNENAHLIEGKSDAAKQLLNYINLVAPTDISVIIQGESGTGKEHVARTIHRLSKRSKAPFVAVDCGAISGEIANSELFGHIKGSFTGAVNDKQGIFEAAQGGTIFLDEVGNLGYDIQVKLLRALQEREIQPLGSIKKVKVNVRVITATNDELATSVREGDFREDLYHRLNEFKIKVPPLRERENDLEIFVDHFIKLSNEELGRNVYDVTPEVLTIFKKYDWPGNLRELKNVVKRAVLLTEGEIAGKEKLPDEMVFAMSNKTNPKIEGPDLKALQEATEREQIVKTLQEAKFNKTKAAKLLNIDRKTLYYKMAKYNIHD